MDVRAVLVLIFLSAAAFGKSVTPKQQVTPSIQVEPLSSIGRIKNPKNFNYGHQQPKQGPLPDPVLISSSIRINKDTPYQPPRNYAPKELNKRQIFIQDQTQLAPSQPPQQGEQTIFYSNQHNYATPEVPLYATPAPLQFQTVTALPLNTNQGQMFLLQQTPQAYSPLTQPISKFVARTGETEQQSPVQPKVSIVSHADPNAQQDSAKRDHGQKEHPKSQQEIQYEEAQQVLQNIIKQQALQQTQQQRQHQFQLAQQIQEQFTIQAQQQAAQAQLEAQQADQNQQILLSTLPQVPIQTNQPQMFQLQTSAQQQQVYQAPNGQTYILHKQEPKEEQTEVTGQPTQMQPQYTLQKPLTPTHPEHKSQTKFIIRHQTYVTGPGGQMFTVPVPVPAEENVNSREGSGEEGAEERKDEGSREEERRDEGPPHRPPPRPLNSFMRRVMEAFSVRGDASERVGTNIALPILASTGVFFGLGALAAGWYLSNANREVGILRRTGKPVPQGTHNVKRIRRHLPTPPPEVDQASFFQSIIQQAIEKQQEQFEDPAVSPAAETEYGPAPGRFPPQNHRFPPQNRQDLHEGGHGDSSANSKVGHRPIQKKSAWFVSSQTLNFFKVAIPAVVLGGAVVAIGVLIFGWYITGSNREIAFLEPSAYSRRKRDITTTALSDGWLQRLLNSIHQSPYDEDPPAFDPLTSLSTSKGNIEYHANVSDAVVAVSLAVIAFLSLLGIVFAWLAAQNEKSNLGVEGAYGFGGWPGSRSKRSLLDSLQLTFDLAQQNIGQLSGSDRN